MKVALQSDWEMFNVININNIQKQEVIYVTDTLDKVTL